MANTKISALPAGAPAQVTDILPVDRAGTNVSLTIANIQAGLAPLASPALTGTPTAPTQSAFTNNTDLATAAYADNNFKGVSIVGFREDFLSTHNQASLTAETVIFADTIWLAHDITAATGTLNGATGTFANPGQLAIVTGAAGSGDGVGIQKGDLASLGALGSNAGWEVNLVFALAQTANCAFRIGVCEAGGYIVDAPTDGMWVEYDTANASSNTDYTWVTASSSTRAFATTDSKAVDTGFHHVRIRSTVSGTIGFTIDGGTEFTTTTDVTTAIMMPFIQVLTRTAGASTLTMDFYSYMAATGRS